jgi:hypothetical protein
MCNVVLSQHTLWRSTVTLTLLRFTFGLIWLLICFVQLNSEEIDLALAHGELCSLCSELLGYGVEEWVIFVLEVGMVLLYLARGWRRWRWECINGPGLQFLTTIFHAIGLNIMDPRECKSDVLEASRRVSCWPLVQGSDLVLNGSARFRPTLDPELDC